MKIALLGTVILAGGASIMVFRERDRARRSEVKAKYYDDKMRQLLYLCDDETVDKFSRHLDTDREFVRIANRILLERYTR